MSMRRMAVLQAGLLLVARFAYATSRNNAIRIKVLDSETRSVGLGGNDVPNNCDQVNFDAYCNNSKTAMLTNTLLVQEDNEPPFRVACTVDSRYSRCTPLPKGESFDARRGKHGITVYYIDDKGKARSQFYTLVGASGKARPPANAAAAAVQPVPPAAASRQSSPAAAPVTQTAAAVQSSPAAAPATQTASAQEVLPKKVMCSFSSIPSGAEITIDWRYVGNTPSEISLSTGTHIVVISAPGFVEWKRELTVVADSVVNVTASLQKAQP